MIFGIRFERDEGESERVSGRGSKNIRVTFWELNLKEGGGEIDNNNWWGLKIFQGQECLFIWVWGSKLIWLIYRCQPFIGYETPNLRLSWYYGNVLYFLVYMAHRQFGYNEAYR